MSDAWGGAFGVAWGVAWGGGAAPTPGREGLGGDDVPRRRSPHPGWNREEWQRRVKDKAEELESLLHETYDRLTGKEAALSTLARVDAIVRPAAMRAEAPDLPLRINWRKMASDYERAQALLRLYREEMELQALMEEDEEVMLMVLQ